MDYTAMLVWSVKTLCIAIFTVLFLKKVYDSYIKLEKVSFAV